MPEQSTLSFIVGAWPICGHSLSKYEASLWWSTLKTYVTLLVPVQRFACQRPAEKLCSALMKQSIFLQNNHGQTTWCYDIVSECRMRTHRLLSWSRVYLQVKVLRDGDEVGELVRISPVLVNQWRQCRDKVFRQSLLVVLHLLDLFYWRDLKIALF